MRIHIIMEDKRDRNLALNVLTMIKQRGIRCTTKIEMEGEK